MKQPLNKQTFMDTDAELYGYSEIEINTIRNAFSAAKNVDVQTANAAKWAHIQKVIAAAKISLATLENVNVEA